MEAPQPEDEELPPAEGEAIDEQTLVAIDEGLAQIARGEDQDFETFAEAFRKEHFSCQSARSQADEPEPQS